MGQLQPRMDPMPKSSSAQAVAPATPEGRDLHLSRADWLSLALRKLVTEGIDQVKVQIMAKELGVARSSFYWHFSSRDDLCRAMMEKWLQKNTGPIIERAMRPAADINLALLAVSECWLSQSLFDPALDIAVRLWARRSDEVRAVIMQADSMRIEAIKSMFVRYGYDARDALIRARTIYFTQIGQFTLEDIEPPALRSDHAIDYIRIFTGKDLTADHVAAVKQAFRRHSEGL